MVTICVHRLEACIGCIGECFAVVLLQLGTFHVGVERITTELMQSTSVTSAMLHTYVALVGARLQKAVHLG